MLEGYSGGLTVCPMIPTKEGSHIMLEGYTRVLTVDTMCR
jgi:hypothetical protein